MKDAILIALAARWDSDAETPQTQDGSESARLANAKDQGYREAKRECADTIRTLIQILGTE